MKPARISSVIEKWPERRIDGKKFNEIFQVDRIPVWYFLEPLIKGAYLPPPFKTLAEMEEDVKSKRFPVKFDLKSTLTQLGLRKGLWLNEKIKWSISSSKVAQTGKKDVLFLCYTNQVIKDKKGKLRPVGFSDVVDALKNRGVKLIVLFCDPLSKNSFKGLLKFPDLLYSYIDSGIIKESKRLSHELNREWKKIGEKKKAELFTFDGRSYWRFFRGELNFLFSKEMLATLITYYLTFKKITKGHKIKVVYLVSLGGFYESLLLGAVYKLKRKVVHSPHGYGDRYFIVRDKLVENVSFVAAGNEDRRRLLKLGIEDGNIFVVGSPFFDKIAEYKSEREEDKTKKTITILPTALVEYKLVGKDEYFSYIRKCLAQISKVKSVKKVIIKLHPDEKYKSEYESVAKSLKLTNVEVVQKPGKDFLYTVLRDSDLLVSFGSTADIEGLMLNKNVIVIDGLKKGLIAERAKKDKYREAVTVINKNDDLTNTIIKVLTDEKVQKKLKEKRWRYLASSFYKIDGRTHERVADLIKNLVQS
jgi:hypothetical protein